MDCDQIQDIYVRKLRMARTERHDQSFFQIKIEKYRLRSKCPQMYQVEIYLTRNLKSLQYLTINPENTVLTIARENVPPLQISWKDILAIREVTDPNKKDKQMFSKIELILFIKREKFLRKLRRYEEIIELYVLPENVGELLVKVRTLLCQSSIPHPSLLIFHNPMAGSNSRRHTSQCIQFLRKTHFQFVLVTTTHKGHCKEYLERLKQGNKNGQTSLVQPQNNQTTTTTVQQDNSSNKYGYWGVVIISGDGLMHQFVNALVDIPVCHIPAGSGNAFAKSQAETAGENCSTLENLYLAMKGVTMNFGVTKYELQKLAEPVYSCLGLEWALLADIDLGSEFLRFFGGLRFELYSVYRVLNLKTYRARLHYSTTVSEMPPLSQPLPDNQQHFKTQEQQVFYSALFMTLPWISNKYNIAPLFSMDQGVIDMQYIPSNVGRWQLIKYLLNSDSGDHFDTDRKTVKEGYRFNHGFVKTFRLEPFGEDTGLFGIDGERYQAQRVQATLLQNRLTMFTLN